MNDNTEEETVAEQQQPIEADLVDNLSWSGKLVFASLASYISDDNPNRKFPIKLKGSPEQVQALVDAVQATKDFLTTSKTPNVSVEEIIKKLNLKNKKIEEFKQATGQDWPLG